MHQFCYYNYGKAMKEQNVSTIEANSSKIHLAITS